MLLILIDLLFFQGAVLPEQAIQYHCDNGRIHFRSDAPLEVIEAESNVLRGAIDLGNNTFAWLVPMRSFNGFNSALQKEHFHENYMETEHFPNATFKGKIIESFQLTKDKPISIRAKGMLNIHGIEQERIIKCLVVQKGDKILVNSNFTVPLSDHNITIPKIVNQKIAEEIFVEINATLTQKN